MRRTIGSSGLTVAPIGLGGMPMSIHGRPSEADALRTIHAALDAGMDLIDTADVYCLDDNDIGHNERLIAKALRERADTTGVVVATKGGLERPAGDWTTNGRPDHLRRACDKSLAALGVTQIQLYQLHAPDDDVPFADSVGALAELRADGKIAHIGLSNVSVEEIEIARAIVPIVSVQNRCNPFDRTAWTDGVVQHCTTHGIAFLPYSPVGGGRGKAKVATDATLLGVGQRHGVSPFQVALAWLLAKSPVMLPIPGASKVASAVDSAAAMKLTLTEADLAELDRAFPT
ncbi:MAG: aldo/keto reductase [Pseudomonadota bacterium]|nr:aldo/keto reductase [Pseudomonadota bacterium]